MESEDSSKQNLKKCMEMSDFIFQNNKSVEELKNSVENVLNELNKKNYIRPSWDEYFIEISKSVAKRATCNRGRSGCVIAKDKQILVTGYVGAPKGLPHCDEAGHQFKKTIHEDGRITEHCVRTTHAEQNAICQAAKNGISIDGATLYCKMTPCNVCAKMIINSGIKRVVTEKDYQASEDSKKMFKEAGIKLEILNKEVEKY
jgi:dCMP deaminase